MKFKMSLMHWPLNLRNSLDQWRLLPLEQLIVSLVLSLNQLMLLRGCQRVQLSGPGLPGVWQLAGDFSLSLLAHGDEAGEEKKGEWEMELEKE